MRQILGCERRVVARIEASTQGLDIRYVVTNLDGGSAEWLYDTLYCARGKVTATSMIDFHSPTLAASARAAHVASDKHIAARQYNKVGKAVSSLADALLHIKVPAVVIHAAIRGPRGITLLNSSEASACQLVALSARDPVRVPGSPR